MKYLRIENCLINISNIKSIEYKSGSYGVLVTLTNGEVIETGHQDNMIGVNFELIKTKNDKPLYDNKKNCFCYTNLVFEIDSIIHLGGDQVTIDDSIPVEIGEKDIDIILKLKSEGINNDNI
jgi:hypothetical protein